ncbi:MAG: hypothetical protein ACI8PT_001406 [Gammaproteobacteria bacterium]|jgi:hypothetical protein
MGVSAHWLQLIEQIRHTLPLWDGDGDGDGDGDTVSTDSNSLLDRYAAISARVDQLWREQGQHVYLHHLNAIFGYQPLVIRETNLKRF